MCPYSEFFWSVFCRIWTEYRSLRTQSNSGKMRTRKKPNTDTFHALKVKDRLRLTLKKSVPNVKIRKWHIYDRAGVLLFIFLILLRCICRFRFWAIIAIVMFLIVTTNSNFLISLVGPYVFDSTIFLAVTVSIKRGVIQFMLLF